MTEPEPAVPEGGLDGKAEDSSESGTALADERSQNTEDAENVSSNNESKQNMNASEESTVQDAGGGISPAKKISLAVSAISLLSGLSGIVVLWREKPANQQFLQYLQSSDTKCKAGRWMVLLSLAVLLAAVVAMIILH